MGEPAFYLFQAKIRPDAGRDFFRNLYTVDLTIDHERLERHGIDMG